MGGIQNEQAAQAPGGLSTKHVQVLHQSSCILEWDGAHMTQKSEQHKGFWHELS